MQTGQSIKTFGHADQWCLIEKKPVLVKRKDGTGSDRQSWKMVSGMSFSGLKKMMASGRLFELHE